MKWFIVVTVVLCIALVGAAVGIAVGLLGRSSSKEEADAKEKAIKECFMRNDSDYPTSDWHSQLRNVVTSAWRWGDSHIDSAPPSQRAALCWLSEIDSVGVEVENGTNYEVVQRFALASVYYHFVGAYSSTWGSSQILSASNWLLDGVHVCQWEFVACAAGQDNRVTELSLDGLRRNRPIPEDIAFLSDLVSLSLTNSYLTGQIPSTISFLTKLQVLDLSVNGLTGTIPAELGGSLSALHTLSFAHNLLTGTLPNTLGNATALHKICIGNNRLSGTIPDISRLTNLKSLSLNDNLIHGSFPGLSRLTNLGEKTMDLDDSYYHDRDTNEKRWQSILTRPSTIFSLERYRLIFGSFPG